MLVLLDESLPNWSGISNGELFRMAQSAGFEAFVTADQNIQYQQNLSSVRLRAIVLELPSNRFAHVRILASQILIALREMQPGELRVLRGAG